MVLLFIKKCMEIYTEWVCITAAALFIIHLLMPHDPREDFPFDDPPPKFFCTFSLGELVQYIIQVLTFPLIMFAVGYFTLPEYSSLSLPENLVYVIGFIILGIWWFVPSDLARKIDGW